MELIEKLLMDKEYLTMNLKETIKEKPKEVELMQNILCKLMKRVYRHDT